LFSFSFYFFSIVAKKNSFLSSCSFYIFLFLLQAFSFFFITSLCLLQLLVASSLNYAHQTKYAFCLFPFFFFFVLHL
jgi:hypothetical protein